MKPVKMILILLCLAITAPLWAGVLMTTVDQRADNPDNQSTSKLYLDKDRLRMEMTGKDENKLVIYRQDKDLFWIISEKDKTYTEFTKADMDRMQQQMEGASKQMEEAMKNMPLEQRAMMEGRMKGMTSHAASKEVYKKVASGQKVGQWTCAQYEGDTEGTKASDVWTTDPKSLGLTKEDFDVLKDMSKFWEGMAKGGSKLFKIDEAEKDTLGHFSGVPVKTVYYSDGKVSHTNELKSIERKNLDASLFELPADYTKQEMEHGRKMHE